MPIMTDTNREKLVLTTEQAQDLMYGDNPEYEVIEDKQIGSGRWSIRHRIVIKRVSDGRFFSDTYSRGATEYQEERPWQDNDPDFREVFAITKSVVVYE